MSSRLYRNLVGLLPQIRVDPGRPGKCLGEFVRNSVSKGFPQGESSPSVDEKIWHQNYEALRALTLNSDQKNFPRRFSSTATGLTPEQCSQAIVELLHKAKDESDDREASLTTTLKKRLNVKV